MRRALLICAGALGVALLLAGTLIAVLVIGGNTHAGRARIENLVSRLSAGQAQIAGLAGSFPSAIELERLQLSDARGVWLTAEHVSLRWSPQALLGWRIKLQSLRAARVAIERLPESAKPRAQSRMSLPQIDADAVTVDLLELGAAVVGTPALFSVRASGHRESADEADVDVVAQPLDGGDRYKLQLRSGRSGVAARLNLEERAGGPLESFLGLPRLGGLSVQAQLQGPRAAERVWLAARAGDLRVQAEGTVDLVGRSANLRYAAHAPAMSPRPGLSWQRIDLEGRWQGTATAPEAVGHLQLDRLQIPGGTGVAVIRADLDARADILSLHAEAEEVTLPGAAAQLLRDSPVRMDLRTRPADRTKLLNVALAHRLFALQAQVVPGESSATFDVRLPDVGPFAALAGETVRGSAAIRGRVARDGGATRISANASGALDPGSAVMTRLLGGAPRLELSATVTDEAMNLERVRLTGRAVSASGSGRAGRSIAGTTSPPLRGRFTVELPDVRQLSDALAGQLQLSGQVDGTLKSFTAQIRATSNLSLQGAPPGAIRANLDVRDLPATPAGRLQLEGSLEGEPLQLDTRVERTRDQGLHIAIVSTDWKSAHLEGDVVTAAHLTQPRGNLQLRIGDLADLQPLFGTEIRGSVAGNLALEAARGGSRGKLRLDAHDVVVGQIAGDGRLAASGPLDAPNFRLVVRLPDLEGSPATLTAAGELRFRSRALRVTRLTAAWRGQSARLMSPATVALFADGLSVEGLKVGLQQAVLEADGRISPELQLRAVVRGVDAALINVFAPGLLAQGAISAEAQVSGPIAAPLGRVSLSAANLRLAGDAARTLPPLDVRATARLAGDAAELDVQLGAGQALRASLGGRAPLNARGVFDLKLRGELDLGFANPLLESEGRRASGRLSADLVITGSTAAPDVNGRIDLAGGDLRDYRLGLHLSDIAASMEGSHGELRITRMSAQAAPGELRMSGKVGILEPDIPIDLVLTARDATPLASDVLTAHLDGNLRLKGTVRGEIDASGQIDLKRVEINIPNSLPPNVAVLDVRRRGAAAPAVKRHRVVGLDLSLSAPRAILVRGRGLDAELGGQLRIRGTSAQPLVSGGFDLIRGSFSLAGTPLKFTEGRVGFNNAGLDNKIDPTLDFTAQSTVGDTTAMLRVTGFADAPQIELTSTPSLPADEILSRLLFGESASQLSPAQAAQLGAALVTMTGLRGDRASMLSRLQKSLGLDRLAFETVSSGSTGDPYSSSVAVSAGRYISDKVYVAGRQSSTLGMQLEVDVDLSKHLKLHTRLSDGSATVQHPTPENDPGNSIGATYQFEY